MGYFVQVLKLACLAVLCGMALAYLTSDAIGVFLGVLIFYVLLVTFVGTARGTTGV